jgi:hypothetical protein
MTEIMSIDDAEKGLEICEAATPGFWFCCNHDCDDDGRYLQTNGPNHIEHGALGDWGSDSLLMRDGENAVMAHEHDAAFIAYARTALPAALTSIIALTETSARMEREKEAMSAVCIAAASIVEHRLKPCGGCHRDPELALVEAVDALAALHGGEVTAG